MPTPRKFTSYPPHYEKLFLDAYIEPMNMPCDTRRACIVYRSHLYAFRSSALIELPEGHEQLLLILPEARTRIEGNTLILYYDHVDKELHHAITRAHRTPIPVENR